MAIRPTKDSRSETLEMNRRKSLSSECLTFPCHQSDALAQYFDVDTKLWKPLASVAQLGEITKVYYSAELIGNYLYVVWSFLEYFVYRYHVLNNTWEKLPKLNIMNSKTNRAARLESAHAQSVGICMSLVNQILPKGTI